MVREAPAPQTSTSLPAQRTADHDTVVAPLQTAHPEDAGRPVSFDRLLSLAALTPAQASLLAEQLLDAAHRAGSLDGEAGTGGLLGPVSLTPSGDLVVAAPPPGGGTPVAPLLDQLVRNARRLPTHPRPEQLLMLQRLEAATRQPLTDPGARARDLEGAMAEALGPGARQRLSQQLAGLVGAIVSATPGAPAPVAAVPRATPAARPPSRPPGRPPRARRTLLQRRRPGRRVALGVLALVAALAVSGYVMLDGPNGGLAESLGLGSHPATPATTTPAHRPKPPVTPPRARRPAAVPTLAARHAGAVTGVAVQRTGTCRPGSLCPVKVTVHLRPAGTSRPVGWRLGAARVCKHGIAWSPPVTMTAQPGWTTAYASSSVRVPKGHPRAIVAVTTAPARAQSRPIPVAGSSLHC